MNSNDILTECSVENVEAFTTEDENPIYEDQTRIFHTLISDLQQKNAQLEKDFAEITLKNQSVVKENTNIKEAM